MKKLTHFIQLAILFLQLNKALGRDAKDLYGHSLCLAYGINQILKDRKVTNVELDELTGLIADTSASLVMLLENFTIPEEEVSEEYDLTTHNNCVIIGKS